MVFILSNLDQPHQKSCSQTPVILDTVDLLQNDRKIQIAFQERERDENSTTKELATVEYLLGSFGSILENESIQVSIVNLNACRILSVGSSKQDLQSLALDIFLYCLLHNIRLQPHWVPREENEIDDYYSKYNDTDDWLIDKISFNNISKRFRP